MNESNEDVPMGSTNELFPEGTHMCMIFDSEELRKKIIAEFLATGLRDGEHVRYMADIVTPEEVRSWLVDLGVELPDGIPFNIFETEKVFCPNGHFNPQETLNGMVSRFEIAKKNGFKRMRGSVEMSWALKGIPGSDRLIEFESLVNFIYQAHAFTGICQYDARLFNGDTLFKVLRVHP